MGLLANIKTFLVEELFLMPEMVVEFDLNDVYLGSIPDTPDDVIGVYATGGYPRDLAGDMIEEPTFMIRIRSSDYASGEIMCSKIADLLHGINAQTVDNSDILLIAQQGDINDIGRDAKNRQEWTINFRMYYRR